MVDRGRLSVFLAATAAVVMTAGVAAFACTNLATVGTSAPSGEAGTAVTVSGSSFAAAQDGAAASPVLIRWNKLDGPVLAEIPPDATGSISGTFTLPEADPGHYVLVATQVDEEGEPQFGTPARVAMEILGPSGESVAPPAAQAAASSSSSGRDSSASTVAVLGLGVLAVGLFAAGCASFLQERRRLAAGPAPQPVRHD